MLLPSSSPVSLRQTQVACGTPDSPLCHLKVTSAGIKGLPSLINACILIFTFSAANSDQYIASRTLYGMARDGHAPMIFARCTKRGVPYVSFIFTGCFMGLAYLVASSGE